MKNTLYNMIINDITDLCYRNCLELIHPGSAVLDIGIGNGKMIKNHASVIKNKSLNITGLDINTSYIQHCRSLIDQFDIGSHIQVYCCPVEQFTPETHTAFDFILFSMSFMLLENQHAVLERVKQWLKPGGRIIFFQTMFRRHNRVLEFLKPRLKYFTTVDFGAVTYEEEFFEQLAASSLAVEKDMLLQKNRFQGEYRLIVTNRKTPG